MNYYIDLKGGMNIRRTPMLADNVISQLPAGTRVEGDELDTTGKWLKVLLIDGVQTTEPTHIATYTTSGVLVTNPAPVEYPDFVYDASTESEWPIEVFHNDVSIGVFEGTIRVVSKNPTLKLT